MHVYIEEIGKHEGQEVTLKGWLHNRRSSGKIHFLILRDGTGFIQGVMSKAAVGEELFKAADHLSQETSVIVTGTARADKPAACEGTTTLFPVEYFEDQKAYLTQSGQLYVEATAMALGKVYSFGPTFRAEKSKTRRHLTEFWMVEPEVAYMELDGLMELAEEFVSHIVQRVLERNQAELKELERDTSPLQQ